MRIHLIPLFVLGLVAPAQAQDSSPTSCRDAYLGPVIVHTRDQQAQRGVLQCLTDADLLLLTEAGPKHEPLINVTRVATLRDGIADGVLKGVLIGVLLGTLGSEGCSSSVADCAVMAGLELGAIGGLIDALYGHSYVIYPLYKTSADLALALQILMRARQGRRA